MTIIQKIIAHKIQELSAARRDAPLARLNKNIVHNKSPSFAAAIKKNPLQRQPNVIAEIKKSSPSKGQLLHDGQITDIATIYESSGASAISILTDQKFFGGSIRDLTEIRETVKIPLLRKDFIFTKNQITEAANNGASAVLLMVTVMTLLVEDDDSREQISLLLEKNPFQDKNQTSTDLLKSLINYAHSLNLDVLVETHSETEIDIAVAAGAKIIGVNSRDFSDLSIDLSIFPRLLPKIPDGIIRVAESGIYSREDIVPIAEHCDAVLIGSSLMESGVDGIREKLKNLF